MTDFRDVMRSTPPTDESAGTCAGVLVIFAGNSTGHDGKAVTSGPLNKPMATGRKIVDEFGMQQVKILEIDHVEVSALSDLK